VQRHEIVGDRIRALDGHSIPGKLRRKRGTPFDILDHGTNAGSISLIRDLGLLPMSRQYVHLSTDVAKRAVDKGGLGQPAQLSQDT
jgi:putative RNA 2'-phosphotransferase